MGSVPATLASPTVFSAISSLASPQQRRRSALLGLPLAHLPIVSFPNQPELSTPNPNLIETEPWTPPTDAHPEIRLHAFVEQAWRSLEPAVPFVASWHIGLLCEHLEAVSTGKLLEPNLLVNTPPGSSKSLIASVLWPAWVWTWAPWTRWLTTSYDDGLALRDAVRTRRLMQTEWYRGQVSLPWAFVGDQKQFLAELRLLFVANSFYLRRH